MINKLPRKSNDSEKHKKELYDTRLSSTIVAKKTVLCYCEKDNCISMHIMKNSEYEKCNNITKETNASTQFLKDLPNRFYFNISLHISYTRLCIPLSASVILLLITPAHNCYEQKNISCFLFTMIDNKIAKNTKNDLRFKIESSRKINPLIEEFKNNKSGTTPRWYTQEEISQHNIGWDCWIVIFNKVYDISSLLKENRSLLSRPLLKFAGCDISSWFDEHTKEVKTYIEEKSERQVSYLPHGRFLHVPPNDPVTDWSVDFDIQWWKDWKYVIGLQTSKSRHIRIINTLTGQSHTLQVCKEEPLGDIQTFRYNCINNNSHKYIWKFQQTSLDMTKTLEENGVIDNEQLFEQLDITEEYFPAICLEFKDELDMFHFCTIFFRTFNYILCVHIIMFLFNYYKYIIPYTSAQKKYIH
ncbi:hypothetical protein RFI_22003 [Reticulomyxa filosa]|uniref:Cytochrome b5 domain-containing protein 1 n=1 Tax=Reticulomyxa filosa TaxID=46433 RepID=X6MMZ2_RETFI|nr:hypothetical protein RFI_22003 [Reticulomyxa filosa]|eukprot:ETO15358.1 hypothetical protein RFI_22003 [Reticulomyxa filosa]